MADELTLLHPLEQVGEVRRVPLWRFVGHDLGLTNRGASTVSLRAALSGMTVDLDLASALARFPDLDFEGRERLLNLARHCHAEGLLNDGDSRAVVAFLGKSQQALNPKA